MEESQFIELLLKDPASGFAWIEQAKKSHHLDVRSLARAAELAAESLPEEARRLDGFIRLRREDLRRRGDAALGKWLADGEFGRLSAMDSLALAGLWAGEADREALEAFGERLARDPEVIAWAEKIDPALAKRRLDSLLSEKTGPFVFEGIQGLFAKRLDPEGAILVLRRALVEGAPEGRLLAKGTAQELTKIAWQDVAGRVALLKSLAEMNQKTRGTLPVRALEGIFSAFALLEWPSESAGGMGVFGKAYRSSAFRLGLAFGHARGGRTNVALAAAAWAAQAGAAGRQVSSWELRWEGGRFRRAKGVRIAEGVEPSASGLMEAALLRCDEELVRGLLALGWRRPRAWVVNVITSEVERRVAKAGSKPRWLFAGGVDAAQAAGWIRSFAEKLELEARSINRLPPPPSKEKRGRYGL